MSLWTWYIRIILFDIYLIPQNQRLVLWHLSYKLSWLNVSVLRLVPQCIFPSQVQQEPTGIIRDFTTINPWSEYQSPLNRYSVLWYKVMVPCSLSYQHYCSCVYNSSMYHENSVPEIFTFSFVVCVCIWTHLFVSCNMWYYVVHA